MNPEYCYTPEKWSHDEFISFGGFSVVFMNYNKGHYIERSVKSALEQDYPYLEMIFMDDASTDGSCEVMEALVREYCGRHKIMLVRNFSNHGIAYQWNVAAKTATGKWLAMFCADDIACPNRISSAAALLKRYPTALGMCTNGVRENIDGGSNEKTPIFSGDNVIAIPGRDMKSIGLEVTPVIGATALWRRSLFDERLPDVPLDDVALRFVLQCKGCDTDNAVWICDGETRSIVYGMDGGVTTKYAYGDLTRFANKRRRWLHVTRNNRKFSRLLSLTWDRLVKLSKKKSSICHCGLPLARRQAAHYRISCGNTFTRLLMLPRLLSLPIVCRGLPFALIGRTWTIWFKLLMQEFFGLQFAALVSSHIIHRR